MKHLLTVCLFVYNKKIFHYAYLNLTLDSTNIYCFKSSIQKTTGVDFKERN